ncbi:MAG: B12-binding domain-containing radical SAM protein [Promethearchaeota archaeon]
MVKTAIAIDEFFKTTVKEGPQPPLNLLYIGECLVRAGHDVKICDQPAQAWSIQKVFNWIKKRDPDILGFGPYVQSLPTALTIAKMAKEWNENMIVVFGNILATVADDQLLSNYPFIDFCLRNEVEKTIPQFVKIVMQNGDPKSVNGLSYRDRKEIKRTPDIPLNRDLDSIPVPDREALIDYDYRMGPNKYTLVSGSRGCPYTCRFCAVGILSNSRGIWRPRSVDNVISELHFLQSCGYKEFSFADDDILANVKRTTELCQRMKKEKIDLIWDSDARVNHANKEVLRRMKLSGCNTIIFGIESKNQEILNYYNKKVTPDQSELAVKNARKAGIENIIGMFVLGAPHETVSDVIQTLKFSFKLDLSFAIYYLLHIHIKSDLWEDGVKMGIIDEDRDWNRTIVAADIFSDSVKRDILFKLIEWALSNFLTRPKFLLKEIFRTTKSFYRLQHIFNLVKR